MNFHVMYVTFYANFEQFTLVTLLALCMRTIQAYNKKNATRGSTRFATLPYLQLKTSNTQIITKTFF